MADALDWKRLSGKARRYQNNRTGEIISRRQFDERYGRLAKQGLKTNEQQAKVNKFREGIEQLAKPARGRTKIKEKDAEIRKAILEARLETLKEKKLSSKYKKLSEKKLRNPHKLSDSNFKPGRMGRKFRVALDYEQIESFIESSSHYSGALGYTLGLEFMDDRTREVGAVTITRLRDFSVKFSISDFDSMMQWFVDHAYAVPLYALVYIALKQKTVDKIAKRKKK